MGIQVGTTVNDLSRLFSNKMNYRSLPVVSFKYYLTDKWVLNLGIKSSKSKKVVIGESDSTLNDYKMTSNETRDVESKFLCMVGVEKHFVPTNVWDVYFGARLPFGMVNDVNTSDVTYMNGNYITNEQKRHCFAYGIDTYVGIQMFVADLPLAFSVEVALSGFGYRNDKVKHNEEFNLNGVSGKQEYQTTDGDDYKYSSLKVRSFERETDVRLTLNYYFRTK